MRLLHKGRRRHAVSQPSAASIAAPVSSVVDAAEALEELVATIALRDLNLIYRLIEEIDRVERDERDPERLGVLYRLDHLANRLRRSGEGRLLLSGHGVPFGREGAMSLADIARAAVGGSQDFRRVQIEAMPSYALIPGAADDTVLLLAELLDNALELSPDTMPVKIGAHLVSAGIALRVEDQGIGLPLHKIPELNARLAEVPVLGVEATEQMGFHVVALLARRLRALIQLQPRQGGGTVAVVVIPGNLVIEIAAAPVSVAPVRETPARGVGGDRWAHSPLPAQVQGVTAHGLPRRTRAQQPWRPEPHPSMPPSRPADPEAVRRDIEDFEAGALRAQQELGGTP